MIEFQADCGHLIQAPENSAGRIIKCAYCGREVEVPPPPGQERDPHFEDLDLDELARREGHRTVTGLAIRGEQTTARAPAVAVTQPPQQLQIKPFLLAGYSIVGLAVVVFVSSSLLRRFSASQAGVAEEAGPFPPASRGRTDPSGADRSRTQPEAPSSAQRPVEPGSRPTSPSRTNDHGGLLGPVLPKGQQGVYVQALSERAEVFIAPQEQPTDPLSSSAFRVGKANQVHVCSPGSYRVAVRLPVDDPQVPGAVQGWLSDQPAHAAVPPQLLRRDASCDTRLCIDADGTTWLARYYDLEIKPLQWRLITALFGGPGTLHELNATLPRAVRYDLDRADALAALRYEEIAEQDHELLLDILARIGQLVYASADGRTQIFEIGLRDGRVDIRPLPLPVNMDDARRVALSQSGAGDVSGPWGAPRSAPRVDPPPPELEDHSGARLQPGDDAGAGPWGHRRRGAATNDPAKGDSTLAQRISQHRQRLDHGQQLEVSELQVDLRSRSWPQSTGAERLAWIELLGPDTATHLVEDLGPALLDDPELQVRLALLGLLVNTGHREVIPFIERRLAAIDQLPPGESDALAAERDALVQARQRLVAGPRRAASRNPWE